MQNIFFLKSPLQLLCAVEAIKEFNLNSNKLVIYDKGKGANFRQIEVLLEHYGFLFDEKTIIEREVKNIKGWLKGFKSIKRIVDNYPKVEKIFIGDYQNGLVRHYQNSVSYKDVFLLDDGFATIYIHKQLHEGSLINAKDYLKFLLSKGEYKYQATNEVNYFTIFNNQISGEKVYFNRFNQLISNDEWKKTDCIYWLGSPIVEDGIVKKKFYLNSIESWIDVLGNERDIIYFPHRREEEDKLLQLEKRFDFECRRIELPIELYVVLKKKKPSKVISFFSTALYSLNKILDDTEVFFIPITEENLLARKAHIADIYSILDIEIQNLKNIKSEKA